MNRIVTLCLIWVLTLFSITPAHVSMGRAHDMTHSMTHAMAHAMQDSSMIETVSEPGVAMTHRHNACPACAGDVRHVSRADVTTGHLPCAHGAFCMGAMVTDVAEFRAPRALHFVDYPPLAAIDPASLAPVFDLPPPRIGSDVV